MLTHRPARVVRLCREPGKLLFQIFNLSELLFALHPAPGHLLQRSAVLLHEAMEKVQALLHLIQALGIKLQSVAIVAQAMRKIQQLSQSRFKSLTIGAKLSIDGGHFLEGYAQST